MKRHAISFGPLYALGFVSFAALAGCGSGREANAFWPSQDFVSNLRAKAEALAKSEMARFNELELTTKEEVRSEPLNNPFSAGNVNFKLYRAYTVSRVNDILRCDSYLTPIDIQITFDYQIMATSYVDTKIENSAQKVLADKDFKAVRPDSVTLHYRCDAWGNLVDPLPGLQPRDSILNPSWNKVVAPGRSIESPVATVLESKRVGATQ